MSPEQSFRQLRNLVIAALLVAMIAFGARFLQPIAIAILLAFVLAPLAAWLERVGLARPAAVCLTLIGFIGAVTAVGYVVGNQLVALADRLPNYEANILERVKAVQIAPGSPLTKLERVAEHVEE